MSIPTGLAGAMNGKPDLVRENVAKIVDLACEAIPEKVGEWNQFGTRFSDDPDSLESRGIHWIERVHVPVPNEMSQSSESVALATSNNRASKQKAIDGKTVPTYRHHVEEHWLLVVGLERTGGSLFVEQVEGREFTSGFARTFLLELYEGRCVELATVGCPAPTGGTAS